MTTEQRKPRRWLPGVPLLPPLVAVVGTILGGWWYMLVVLAVAVPCVQRLWRVGVMAALFAAVVGLQMELHRESCREIEAQHAAADMVELSGTVERCLQHGCILRPGLGQARVVVRGEMMCRPGDELRVWAEPLPERPAGVPGTFDGVAWRRGQGIAAEYALVREVSRCSSWSFYTIRAWGLNVRDDLVRRMMPPGTEDDARRQVLCALVLGARDSAELETLAVFQRGGCMHAFAVSGLHVGLFFVLVVVVLNMLRVRPVVQRPLILLVVGAYVVVTGCAVPAIRAYVMMAVMLGALMLRRRAGLLNTWCFAALLVLAFDPTQLWNAGFLLSFAVYAALCLGLRLCMREEGWFDPDSYIPRRIWTKTEKRLAALDVWLRGIIVVSLSAWLVALPITMIFFHTCTPWSVLTNIAITPILPVVMVAGLLHVALGWIPWVGMLTGAVAVKSAGVLMAVVGWFGDLPGAWLPTVPPAPPNEILVCGTGYGQSFTLLGNPGVVINPGNERTVEMQTQPTIFHAGYQPLAVVLARSSESAVSGAARLLQLLNRAVPMVRSDDVPAAGLTIRGEQGEWTLYPPPADFPRNTMDNVHPIIAWQQDNRRVLYVGNASAELWYHVPEETRRADVVILGRHPVMPINDVDSLRKTGAKHIIILPGTEAEFSDEALAPAKVLRMQERDWLRLP